MSAGSVCMIGSTDPLNSRTHSDIGAQFVKGTHERALYVVGVGRYPQKRKARSLC